MHLISEYEVSKTMFYCENRKEGEQVVHSIKSNIFAVHYNFTS